MYKDLQNERACETRRRGTPSWIQWTAMCRHKSLCVPFWTHTCGPWTSTCCVDLKNIWRRLLLGCLLRDGASLGKTRNTKRWQANEKQTKRTTFYRCLFHYIYIYIYIYIEYGSLPECALLGNHGFLGQTLVFPRKSLVFGPNIGFP